MHAFRTQIRTHAREHNTTFSQPQLNDDRQNDVCKVFVLSTPHTRNCLSSGCVMCVCVCEAHSPQHHHYTQAPSPPGSTRAAARRTDAAPPTTSFSYASTADGCACSRRSLCCLLLSVRARAPTDDEQIAIDRATSRSTSTSAIRVSDRLNDRRNRNTNYAPPATEQRILLVGVAGFCASVIAVVFFWVLNPASGRIFLLCVNVSEVLKLK